RKQMAQALRAQRGRALALVSGVVVALLLGLDSLVWSRPKELSPPEPLPTTNGPVSVDTAGEDGLAVGKMKRYVVKAGGKQVRFLLLKQRNKTISCALDACALCGDKGYNQVGESIICRNCAAEINVPSIGQPGGCNPVPLK